jgi:hypothetical protein
MLDRPHPQKQQAIALAAAAGYVVTALCYHWQDCLALALTKHISVVVCAIDPGAEVRDAFDRVGATVVVARQQTVRIRRDVNQLIERLYRRGIVDTQEIADILEVDTKEVRRTLRGLRRE